MYLRRTDHEEESALPEPERQRYSDQKTFIESLVKNYHGVLVNFLKRRLSTTEDAEDMAQETYYRIARKDDVTSIRDPHAFLFKVAVNLLRDNSRRDISRGPVMYTMLKDDSLSCEMPSQERVVSGKQALRVFETLLEGLPPNCRHVFILHRFKDMSYPEIAKHCGISRSGVEKHMMRALAYLNENMGVYVEGDEE